MRSGIIAATVLVVVTHAGSVAADNYKLPASITPAVQAACEGDVRRLCLDSDPSFSKIKACVIANFGKFGTRCKVQAALAGIKP